MRHPNLFNVFIDSQLTSIISPPDKYPPLPTVFLRHLHKRECMVFPCTDLQHFQQLHFRCLLQSLYWSRLLYINILFRINTQTPWLGWAPCIHDPLRIKHVLLTSTHSDLTGRLYWQLIYFVLESCTLAPPKQKLVFNNDEGWVLATLNMRNSAHNLVKGHLSRFWVSDKEWGTSISAKCWLWA